MKFLNPPPRNELYRVFDQSLTDNLFIFLHLFQHKVVGCLFFHIVLLRCLFVWVLRLEVAIIQIFQKVLKSLHSFFPQFCRNVRKVYISDVFSLLLLVIRVFFPNNFFLVFDDRFLLFFEFLDQLFRVQYLTQKLISFFLFHIP